MAKKSTSANSVEGVVELLKEAAAEDYLAKQKVSWTKLKNAAQQFEMAYKQLDENAAMYSRNLLRQAINNPDSPTYIKNLRGSHAAYLLRAKYLLAFNFDRYLTMFLDELPKEALYVYEEEGQLTTYNMSMQSLAKYADKEGRLRLSKNQLMQESQKGERVIENRFPQEHIAKAQAAYQGTVARLNEYYDAANVTNDSERQGGILMWKTSHDWELSRVLNKGDIKEAYAAFLLTEHQSQYDVLANDNSGTPKYYDDTMIANFYKNYIFNVTNKAAIVEEDIITSTFQYGVKSEAAPMPSLNQYLTTARWIKKQKSPLTKEEVKLHINQTFPQDVHRNKIIESIDSLSDKEIEAMLKAQKNIISVTNL